MPVHTTTQFPYSPDGAIPDSYAHFVDPFVALARASTATKTLKLGTGIVLVPERDPLVMAKEISTLDLFSGGRFLFGIGAGWLREESLLWGPISTDAGARRARPSGDERALDQRGGRVPRPVL
jgi:alkanesulfonate monooxygenase SsuD/methylene tetrahydromethanopterin reductase-like flavin-dependent oxidoreductase (luciferase family)